MHGTGVPSIFVRFELTHKDDLLHFFLPFGRFVDLWVIQLERWTLYPTHSRDEVVVKEYAHIAYTSNVSSHAVRYYNIACVQLIVRDFYEHLVSLLWSRWQYFESYVYGIWGW